ncbi:MAG: 23S rRNA (adenine(2503)-C(2))-methyltransferase RlmN [Deltaproteobacteria bacterium]|nr:23S rRNA (adenine(2503)-C(2))-methyltransferase RlmN [Deltaproteobacteria bacterium]
MDTCLQGETPESLLARLEHLGATLPEARRLCAHVLQRGHDDYRAVSQVRARVRDGAGEAVPVGRLEVREVARSLEDPFVKYVLECPDGALLETVRIPLEAPGRFSVCVSSQVGCAMGCVFCATGRMGLRRNLHAWEIIEQVRRVARDLRASGEGRVHGVVFQGMGEPLHNVDNVLRALEVLSNPCGLAIDARNITVCTVGVVPGILRLAEATRRPRLGISVTSARAALRRTLVPLEAKYPLEDVIDAARVYQARSRRLVMLAYPLLGGVNMDPEEARALATLLKRLPARLSLIEWNPVPGVDLRRPTEAERNAFHDALASLGVPVVRRYSGGKDIAAACGQLATETGRRR